LTFIGHVKGSLWSVDLFRCESILLRSHWVLLVMDVCTRRLIGTIRREYLDHVFFWNAIDLSRKLDAFADYYNTHRVHRSLHGTTPARCASASSPSPARAALRQYAWEEHCRGLFHTPIPV